MERRRVGSASPFEELFGFCRAQRVGSRVLVALEQLGADCGLVVRTRMLLTHIEDRETVGRVHGEYFRATMPVATTVEVSRSIDLDWRVEIEAEAIVPSPAAGSMSRPEPPRGPLLLCRPRAFSSASLRRTAVRC